MSRRAVTPAGRRRIAARTTTRGGAEDREAKPRAPSDRAPAGPRPAPSPTPPRARKPSPTGKGAARPATRRRLRKRTAKGRGLFTPTTRGRRRAPAAGGPSRWRAVPSAVWRLLRGRGSLRRRAIVVLGVVLALTALYFGWFRDSSLVAVNSVKVEGLEGGGGATEAVAALTSAAEGMSTLDVDSGRLTAVAAQYPEIAAVSADPDFPHGMTIHVTPRPAVLLARDGDRTVPVAADGTLLVGDRPPPSPKLPTLAVHPLPSAGRLGGTALQEALVAGAAPAPLRRQISGLSFAHDSGVTATMRGGIELRFGSAGAARAKWAAAAAVLADRRLTTLAYVDVRVPGRPAVG